LRIFHQNFVEEVINCYGRTKFLFVFYSENKMIRMSFGIGVKYLRISAKFIWVLLYYLNQYYPDSL